MNRREFFKFSMATGALAIIPLEIVEALVAPLTPPAPKVTLWMITGWEYGCDIGESNTFVLRVMAGSHRLTLRMFMPTRLTMSWHYAMYIDLDIRMENGKCVLYVDDQRVEDIQSIEVDTEDPLIDITSWHNDGTRAMMARKLDDAAIKELTIVKEFR